MNEQIEVEGNQQEIVDASIQENIQQQLQAFQSRYSFSIDQFQLEAMAELSENRSVMVAAPTGTGKTLVAEYAIWLAQQRGQRVIYTTPLKALSNQKYRDLRDMYGSDTVGLVTGDIVEHSRASIVIMTTEVYRNMLLEDGGERFGMLEPTSLNDVGFVVFDELHYLSDVERGPVWEEAIVCSPEHVQLVGLSATVSNAEDLEDWISRVHRPISLITHEQRAVPLEHYYFLDGKLHLVQDADGKRVEKFPNVGGEARLAQMMGRGRVYSFDDDEDDEEEEEWLKEKRQRREERERGKQANLAKERGEALPENGQQTENSQQNEVTSVREQTKAKRQPKREAPEPGEVLTALRDADMLPCLYFLPGRRVVEEGAMSAASHSFTTPEEEAAIRAEIDVWLTQLPKEDRKLQQVISLTGLLPRGLAFHHAGLLPGLKVLVETLFARGYLRAVFATDTLALGVNMPARTVVVGSLSKFDGQEMRLLTPNEYRQLTGRAGRRGMDVRGSAVIPYSPWEPFEPSFQRITGELLPVTSAFVIRYNSVLNLWRPGDVQHLRRICASSLREYQRYRVWEINELQRLQKRYEKAKKPGKKAKKKGPTSAEAIQALEKRRERIGAFPLSRAGAAELDGTIFALRALGYIGQDDQLTLKGRLLRSIFHQSGVLIVEMMMQGILDDLTPAELAEVFSWFTFNSDRRVRNRNVVHAKLVQVRRQLWHVVQQVNGIEERASLSYTSGISAEYHGIALAWSRGMSLDGLLRRIELAEGDILMSLNQTIDLLQQVQAAVGQVLDARDIWEQVSLALTDGVANERTRRQRTEELETQRTRLERLRPLLAQSSASLMRGIIIQSRTVPSMVAQIGEEAVPLDAEEDRDSYDLDAPQTFNGEV